MIIEEAALGPGDVSTSGPGEFYGPHMAGSEGVTTLEIFSRQAGLFPVLEKPRPDSNEIHRLREQLQAHLITPAEAATDPAIDQWVKVALNERAALRKEVEERMKAPCLT